MNQSKLGSKIDLIYVLLHLLLNKWLWRFGSDPNNLWRRLIVASTDSVQRNLLSNHLQGNNSSWRWRGITSPLLSHVDRFTGNLRLILGDGNDAAFNDKQCLALLGIGYCVKSKWPKSILPINEIIKSLTITFSLYHKSHVLIAASWVAFIPRILKFNVDGAVKGRFSMASIGGILRDHNGVCFARFSKSIGELDPNSAELVVILEVSEIMSTTVGVHHNNMILEFDSLSSVSWIKNLNFSLAHLTGLVSRCKVMCTRHNWVIKFIHRERNIDAHNLDKEGISRVVVLLWLKENEPGVTSQVRDFKFLTAASLFHCQGALHLNSIWVAVVSE
ncbi:hypothetical protein F3Y22_tig00110890pilonHSYRG01134 [Hibiscus syriacus]|uniref:RNase H type-1 domain-containing protein n=1 Tax=Hibiscus syriacus TaxID=106335 RepID=A0A6A2ZIH2_HIBSY|nr:hypothetical protein F3Y22_tig00110890pilonHSYRG01134 [Hibiscus syriacus]